SSTFIESPEDKEVVGVGRLNLTWRFKYTGVVPTILLLTDPKIEQKTFLKDIKSQSGKI
ncbi:Hypothetical predicted protein, partial [Paramuricea clavata]